MKSDNNEVNKIIYELAKAGFMENLSRYGWASRAFTSIQKELKNELEALKQFQEAHNLSGDEINIYIKALDK